MAAMSTWLGGRTGRTLALVTAGLLAIGGCSAEVAASTRAAASAGNAGNAGNVAGVGTAVVRTGGAETRIRPAAITADAAAPVRLRIPAIGVSARVIALKLDGKGRLIAPKSFVRVGWNKAGPEPGERGAAVIAGHVDSRTGPAVFYRLRQLRKGDRVHVDRADGSTVSFTVYRVARYAKNKIPNKQVYGPTSGAQLRLITCGGTFDRSRRSYRDNVVVFAR